MHSCTNIAELDKKMSEGVVTAYLGPSSSLVWIWRTRSSQSIWSHQFGGSGPFSAPKLTDFYCTSIRLTYE